MFVVSVSGGQHSFYRKGREMWLQLLSLFNQVALWSVEYLSCSVLGGRVQGGCEFCPQSSTGRRDLAALLIELLRWRFQTWGTCQELAGKVERRAVVFVCRRERSKENTGYRMRCRCAYMLLNWEWMLGRFRKQGVENARGLPVCWCEKQMGVVWRKWNSRGCIKQIMHHTYQWSMKMKMKSHLYAIHNIHVNRMKVNLEMGKMDVAMQQLETFPHWTHPQHSQGLPKTKIYAVKRRRQEKMSRSNKILLPCYSLPQHGGIRRKKQCTREKVSEWAIKCITEQNFSRRKMWKYICLWNLFSYVEFVPFIFHFSVNDHHRFENCDCEHRCTFKQNIRQVKGNL